MQTSRTQIVPFLLAVLTSTVFADDRTARAQVRSELTEARRANALPAGDSDLWTRAQYPGLYPDPSAGPGKTRAQVRFELEEARRRGDLVVGQSGLRQNEIAPHLYPPVARGPSKTRAEVRAELDEARLLGELQAGDSGLTWAEIFPQHYAEVHARRAASAQRQAESAAAHAVRTDSPR